MARQGTRFRLHHRFEGDLVMDAARLEVLWSNLISTVQDQAKVLQRTAFSSIVREAGDLASAVFDIRGRMVAQAITGTPGHINSLAICAGHLMKAFPASGLSPGDVLITNDPWLGAGHFFDITLLTPVFFKDKIVAYFGTTIHHTDIGGYGLGAGARDVYEEGLWIPPLKLYVKGEKEPVLHKIIEQNVRRPGECLGDLAAQVSSARIGSELLIALLQRHGLDDIENLSDEIIGRTEREMRSIIRKLPSGISHGETRFDVPGGKIITLKTALTVDSVAGDILIDFDGSSPSTDTGINVCMNYTHAYSTFAVMACLAPQLPNNYGSMTPIRVAAPKGSIVNCEPPSPVNARHVVGMYVPMPIIKALYHVAPTQVLAESAGAPWLCFLNGKWMDGRPFIQFWGHPGGVGARHNKPGLSATSFPSGVSSQPIEMIEASSPVVFLQKELLDGSGGIGQYRGGDGQVVKFRVRTNEPWSLDAATSRTDEMAEGIGGGSPGQPGLFKINGVAISTVGQSPKMKMGADDVVEIQTPGGGGYGPPPSLFAAE